MIRSHARSGPLRLIPITLCAAVMVTAGCRGDTKDSAVGRQARAAVAREAPADTPTKAAAEPDSMAAEGLVTIRGLTGGDRACYVDLDSAGVAKPQQEAEFTLCERRELVGKPVRITRKRMWVLAAACQGDPECARRDTVNLIVAVRAVPSASAAAGRP
ncbi:MAG: hypothetical protein JO306_05360 [Gemmatimonadetes bacterium]|nr:hypothetical protein [Gemmatimonadota bacterium]